MPDLPSTHFQHRLYFWLFLKAMVMIGVILYAGIGLGPDEAQYWTWSRSLDWGYYSKPPGIAWQIGLGTFIFGQTELGVRFLSVVFSFFQGIAIFRLAESAGLHSRTAFWCGICMAWSPLGILGSLFAITDVGFLLCWTAACLVIVQALKEQRAASPYLVGMWILIGALFKWPIYFFWVFFLLARTWYFPTQSIKTVVKGILVSLVGLFPSLWWNFSHDWATFRHVFSTLQGGSGKAPASGNVLEFLGAQVALISPILFSLLCMAMWKWWKNRQVLSPPLFFCGSVSLICLSAAITLACFQKIQGNWCTFAYPTAFVLLGWYALEMQPLRLMWSKMGVIVSVCLTCGILLLPYLYLHSQLVSFPYRLNPFKHNMGVENMASLLEENGYDPAQHFLVSDKYQTTSQLSFYGKEQKRAYFLNLQGMRKNQFSYWPSLQEEQQGKTGYFIWIENQPHLEREREKKEAFYLQALQPYFEKVESKGCLPLLSSQGERVKGMLLFRCEQCQDIKDLESELY